MNKELELENYLSISPNKFAIYSFDTNSFKNLYKEETIINQNKNFIDFDLLKIFLDKNIFKIEKLSGKFVKNIFLICDDKNILNLKIGIKKKIIMPLLIKIISKTYLKKLKIYFQKTIKMKKLCI